MRQEAGKETPKVFLVAKEEAQSKGERTYNLDIMDRPEKPTWMLTPSTLRRAANYLGFSAEGPSGFRHPMGHLKTNLKKKNRKKKAHVVCNCWLHAVSKGCKENSLSNGHIVM